MFDPKNRIHWLAVIVIAIILILILGVTSTASGQESGARYTPATHRGQSTCSRTFSRVERENVRQQIRQPVQGRGGKFVSSARAA